jgi:hypothetical protein
VSPPEEKWDKYLHQQEQVRVLAFWSSPVCIFDVFTSDIDTLLSISNLRGKSGGEATKSIARAKQTAKQIDAFIRNDSNV